MNAILPRSVVMDLLPLYLADELSPETRQLVEQYLDGDASLGAQVRLLRAESPPMQTHISQELELRSVRRTRRQLAVQRWIFGLALAFTAIGFSISIDVGEGRVGRVQLMLLEQPMLFGQALVIAAGLWIAYVRMRRA